MPSLPPLNQPLRKCDFIGKFSANGTRVDIRKLVRSFAPRRQWIYGNLPARGADVIKWGAM